VGKGGDGDRRVRAAGGRAGDPTAGLLDGLSGDAAVVRRAGFGLLCAGGPPDGVDGLATATD
jgi:hypothetical protein